MHAKAWQLFAGSWLIVLMQCIVALGVLAGTELPSCTTNDQCNPGLYCRVGLTRRCEFCSDTPMLIQIDPATGDTFNYIYDEHYAGMNETYAAEVCADPTEAAAVISRIDPKENQDFVASTVVAWCDNCVHSGTGSVDTLSRSGLSQAHVEIMKITDWLTLFLSVFVVSLKLCGELKDISLCSVAIAQHKATLTWQWQFGLTLLGGMRRWTFLNTIVCVVTQLVFLQGGDAQSVCE